MGKEIKIEDIEIKNMGNKYCVSKIEDSYGGCVGEEVTTEGKFIKIKVSLKNISKKTISVGWGLGILIDNQEREYLFYDQASKTFLPPKLNNIAPGFSDIREELYEIPLDSEPLKVKLSSWSFKEQFLELK